MFTNKREIKKYIDRMGTDIAEILLPGAVYTKVITDDQAIEILNKLSALRTEALSRINISFDKSEAAFDNVAAYKAARRRYFKEAYGKALKEYESGVEELLAPINKGIKKK